MRYRSKVRYSKVLVVSVFVIYLFVFWYEAVVHHINQSVDLHSRAQKRYGRIVVPPDTRPIHQAKPLVVVFELIVGLKVSSLGSDPIQSAIFRVVMEKG